MLLLLAEWLTEYNSFFAVFSYLTLRGILGVLTALAISLFWGLPDSKIEKQTD